MMPRIRSSQCLTKCGSAFFNERNKCRGARVGRICAKIAAGTAASTPEKKCRISILESNLKSSLLLRKEAEDHREGLSHKRGKAVAVCLRYIRRRPKALPTFIAGRSIA